MLGHTKSPVANDNDSRYDSHQQMTMIKDKKMLMICKNGLIVLLACSLFACGGGGGGSPAPAPAPAVKKEAPAPVAPAAAVQ